MNPKNSRLTFKILIFLTSLYFLVPLLSATNVQDEDTKAYKQAYDLILEENWEEANEALAAFIGKYSQSAWVDDASFWQCYTMEKLRHSMEEVFNCYQKFIKAYPESKWVDDAKSNLIRIGHQLSKSGKPEYEAVVKMMEESADMEVKLAALYALEDIGDEQALEAVLDLYDETADMRLRVKIISVLEDFESPKAFAKVKEIVLKDPDPYLRRRALHILIDMESKEAAEVMKQIAKTDTDPKVRKTAIYEIADTEDPAHIPFLTEVAITENRISPWPKPPSMLLKILKARKQSRP